MEISQSRATSTDAHELARVMRADDQMELWAEGRMPPYEALEHALRVSGFDAWTLRVNGEIMAMWGVSPVCLLSGWGIPWLLTSYAVDRHPKTFLRCSRLAIAQIKQRYALLFNRIDARYDKAVRWARRVGFTVDGPHTVNGYTFYSIMMKGA